MTHNTTAVPFFATPPLRYVGSKWMLAEWIISHFPAHHVYVEPFVGSGAVFFRKHRSQIEVINDLDGELLNFFEVLRARTDELVFQIRWTPWSEAEYLKSFEPAEDPIERARRFYVSVWQSFASTPVYQSGWRHQLSANQRSLVVNTWRRVDGLLAAANRLMDAQIACSPATEAIMKWDSPQTLFYVDPPYVKSVRSEGSRNRYRHEMDDSDHRALAAVLRSVEGMVILSGYDCPLYRELYGDWTRLEKTTTTNGNGSAIESLWLSPAVVSVEALPLFRKLP